MALKLFHRACVLQNGMIMMEGKVSDLPHAENVKDDLIWILDQ
ncbi:MAG: hypothetical protein ACYDGO_04205 [Smithellaceae bacterium]